MAFASQFGTPPGMKPSNATPQALGSASAGVSKDGARADHVHPSGPVAIAAPTSRAIALGMAYQATNPTKAALMTINLSSSASLSLSGGTVVAAEIVTGPTAAVAGGTGIAVGRYNNTLSGALVIGLAVNNTAASPCSFFLPVGHYFACRQTSGTVTITSAFDQALG
jgi:hypothetical protein